MIGEQWREEKLEENAGIAPDELHDQDARQRLLVVLGDKLTTAPESLGIADQVVAIHKLFAQIEQVNINDVTALHSLKEQCAELVATLPSLRQRVENNRRLDFHVHADGFLDLRQFVRDAVAAGTVVLINTDHNSLYHQSRLRELASEEGLFLPFDGAELTVLDDSEHKFHLKLYTDPTDQTTVSALLEEHCQVPVPPLATDLLSLLESRGISYWAVIAHPGDKRVGIEPDAAIELIRKHNIQVETEHPVHSPGTRRLWRNFVVRCNNRPDIVATGRRVYAEGGSDFHHRAEGERLGWGLVTGDRIHLSFDYLDVVGGHFAKPYECQLAEAIIKEDYAVALKATLDVARRLPLKISSYYGLAHILNRLLVKADKATAVIDQRVTALQEATTRRELVPLLRQVRVQQEPQRLAAAIGAHIRPDSDPEVCLAALEALQRLSVVTDNKPILTLLERPDTLPDLKAAALRVMANCVSEEQVEYVWQIWCRQSRHELAAGGERRGAGQEMQQAMSTLLANRAGPSFFLSQLASASLQAQEAEILLAAIANSDVLLQDRERIAEFFAQHVRILSRRFPYLQVLIHDCACRYQNDALAVLRDVYKIADPALANHISQRGLVLTWPAISRYLAEHDALLGKRFKQRQDLIQRYPVVAARQLLQASREQLAAGEEAAALESLQKVLVLDPKVSVELMVWIKDSLIHTHPLLARELLFILPAGDQPDFWLLRAHVSAQFEDYEDVVLATERYVELTETEEGDVARYRTLALWRLGRQKLARRALKKLLGTDGDDRRNLLLAVELEPKSTTAAFRALQQLEPHEPVSLRLVTNALLRKGEGEEVIKLLLPAAGAGKLDRFLRINLAKAYERAGQADCAWPHWLEAYYLDPRSSFLNQKVRETLQSDILLRRQHSRLASDFGLVPPPLSGSEIILGDISVQCKGEAAARRVADVRTKRNQLATALLNCVKIQCAGQQWRWAHYACQLLHSEHLLAADTTQDYVTALLHVGNLALSHQAAPEAETAMQEVLAIQPANVYAWHYLSEAYALQNKTEQTVQACLSAWRLAPKVPVLLQNLVRALEAVGDATNAARFQDKLRRLTKDLPEQHLAALPPLPEGGAFERQRQELREVIGRLDSDDKDLARIFRELLT